MGFISTDYGSSDSKHMRDMQALAVIGYFTGLLPAWLIGYMYDPEIPDFRLYYQGKVYIIRYADKYDLSNAVS